MSERLRAQVQIFDVNRADASGTASFSLLVPNSVRLGLEVDMQAVVVRGVNGAYSAKSGTRTMTTTDFVEVLGCTDPAALNFNPAANTDDGSCLVVAVTTPGYAGPAGSDLSADGWTLCSGTGSASTTSTEFYPPCAGTTEVRFACSADADDTAEYISAAVPRSSFVDGTCDDWDGGAGSPYAGGHILAIDDTDPDCGQFNVAYDLYMDMVSPQWGCAGVQNTHLTVGRMWMYERAANYVLGCTDPEFINYDASATVDDGSCSNVAVPGFAGVLGPDLTASGFVQCAGTDSGGTSWVDFFSLCEGYNEVVFACSAGPDTTAEYTSAPYTYTGQVLSDATCDDWAGGAISPYFGGHILSIDDSDPTCSSFNVAYDLYMDTVSPQWGCAGNFNTHSTGGRMWAWVR